MMKVLIADDDPISCRLLDTLISNWGYTVISASSGREAWEKFKSDRDIHLVVTDWMMPDLDGIQICRNIRGMQDSRYTYIILLTAKTQIHDLVAGIEAGADDFVTKPFNQHELKARITSGSRMVRLENDLEEKIRELTIAYALMRQDLEAAAQLQKNMLPPEGAQYTGIRCAWKFKPWDQVGGDLFNIVELQNSSIGLYILDVSGHGVPAALQTVALGRMLSPYDPNASLLINAEPGKPDEIVSPGEVACRLNQRFQFATSKGDFITFLYGVLNPESMNFRYSRAGHTRPIHISDGKSMSVADDGGGIPIGILPDYEYRNYEISVKKGDRLYLYTDGLIEATNADGERIGENRIAELLASAHGSDLEECISGLIIDVANWHEGKPLSDDLTIVGVELT